MTPERARELAEGYRASWPLGVDIENLILAACAEERKAALTEAAEACRKIARYDYDLSKTAGVRDLAVWRGNRADDCATDIESLRDRA